MGGQEDTGGVHRMGHNGFLIRPFDTLTWTDGRMDGWEWLFFTLLLMGMRDFMDVYIGVHVA